MLGEWLSEVERTAEAGEWLREVERTAEAGRMAERS